MNCTKCNKDWCWICGHKYYKGHYIVPFGCPGSQFSDTGFGRNLFTKFIILIFMPLILLFGPILFPMF